jgi:hypothetical protein
MRLRHFLHNARPKVKQKRPKVFCIGLNKTGTTSVEKALRDLGYKLGDQNEAQGLVESYAQRKFQDIVQFCHSADAFQDAPFSWHYTFMFLDQAFPDARFILTVRNSEDEWYESLVRFHSKVFGQNGAIPTEDDLKKAWRGEGRTAWDNFNVRHELVPRDPYNKNVLQTYYREHNRMVKDYFRFRNNLLVINLAEPDSYKKVCSFIGESPLYDSFPWENRTA